MPQKATGPRAQQEVIPMKKKVYRAVDVKDFRPEAVSSEVAGKRIVVGIDAAKRRFVATLMGESKDVIATIKWEHPRQTREFIALIRGLPASGKEAAIESTGSYGAPVIELLRLA